VLHEAMGRVHGWVLRVRDEQAGQGTVEYAGLMLLVAIIIGGVVAAGFKTDQGIATKIADVIKDGIDDVIGGKPGGK
jgi:hypothetical protein